MAPLLPKLRGYFAEFLNNASPVGLRILSSPTCVGLRYGLLTRNSGFSRHKLHSLLYSNFDPSTLRFICGFAYRYTIRFYVLSHSTLELPSCVPTFLIFTGAGIFTSYPSTTPCGLALGPDLPREDKLDPGNLGYSAFKILT